MPSKKVLSVYDDICFKDLQKDCLKDHEQQKFNFDFRKPGFDFNLFLSPEEKKLIKSKENLHKHPMKKVFYVFLKALCQIDLFVSDIDEKNTLLNYGFELCYKYPK